MDKKITKCKYCGSTNIGVFIQGEPIYKCKDCGKYLGTVPFPTKESVLIDEAIEKNLDVYKEELSLYEHSGNYDFFVEASNNFKAEANKIFSRLIQQLTKLVKTIYNNYTVMVQKKDVKKAIKTLRPYLSSKKSNLKESSNKRFKEYLKYYKRYLYEMSDITITLSKLENPDSKKISEYRERMSYIQRKYNKIFSEMVVDFRNQMNDIELSVETLNEIEKELDYVKTELITVNELSIGTINKIWDSVKRSDSSSFVSFSQQVCNRIFMMDQIVLDDLITYPERLIELVAKRVHVKESTEPESLIDIFLS